MSETKSMESARDLLVRWFEEEFARGRCDAWERYFAPNVEVTMSDGRVLATLDDWCAAYARSVNDRALVGVTVTASFGEAQEKVAIFWEATDETRFPVHGAFLAECEAGRIAKLLCFETTPRANASSEDDGALPDGNWWF